MRRSLVDLVRQGGDVSLLWVQGRRGGRRIDTFIENFVAVVHFRYLVS
jgi:hypothetical protein